MGQVYIFPDGSITMDYSYYKECMESYNGYYNN
jgi:hypothetical protein